MSDEVPAEQASTQDFYVDDDGAGYVTPETAEPGSGDDETWCPESEEEEDQDAEEVEDDEINVLKEATDMLQTLNPQIQSASLKHTTPMKKPAQAKDCNDVLTPVKVAELNAQPERKFGCSKCRHCKGGCKNCLSRGVVAHIMSLEF